MTPKKRGAAGQRRDQHRRHVGRRDLQALRRPARRRSGRGGAPTRSPALARATSCRPVKRRRRRCRRRTPRRARTGRCPPPTARCRSSPCRWLRGAISTTFSENLVEAREAAHRLADHEQRVGHRGRSHIAIAALTGDAAQPRPAAGSAPAPSAARAVASGPPMMDASSAKATAWSKVSRRRDRSAAPPRCSTSRSAHSMPGQHRDGGGRGRRVPAGGPNTSAVGDRLQRQQHHERTQVPARGGDRQTERQDVGGDVGAEHPARERGRRGSAARPAGSAAGRRRRRPAPASAPAGCEKYSLKKTQAASPFKHADDEQRARRLG